MSYHTLKLDAFAGIVTDKSENNLSLNNSPDACNMDTQGGKLSVAKGFSRVLPALLPFNAKHRLFVMEKGDELIAIACCSEGIYKYYTDIDAWVPIFLFTGYSISPSLFDFQLARIGSEEYLLIAYGHDTPLKWDLSSSNANYFGSAQQLSDSSQNFLEIYYNRLFAAGNPEYPARLFWSKAPGDNRTIEDWRMDNNSPNVSGGHVEVGIDSDPITGLFALSNQLLIFKRDSLYRLLGDRPSNFRILPVEATLEQPLHTACVLRGDKLYFLTKSGLCYYDGQTVQHPRYSTALDSVLSKADLSGCVASACGNMLYFAIKEDPSSQCNDALIEFDVTRETFMIRRGFKIEDMCSCHNKQYILTDTGALCILDDSDTYDGAPINAHWTTPLLDLDSKVTQKQLLELYACGEGELCVDVITSSNLCPHRTVLVKDELSELPLRGGGRQFRLRFSNRDGKHFTIETGVEVLLDLQRRIM